MIVTSSSPRVSVCRGLEPGPVRTHRGRQISEATQVSSPREERPYRELRVSGPSEAFQQGQAMVALGAFAGIFVGPFVGAATSAAVGVAVVVGFPLLALLFGLLLTAGRGRRTSPGGDRDRTATSAALHR